VENISSMAHAMERIISQKSTQGAQTFDFTALL
jgi:hypothetical protein